MTTDNNEHAGLDALAGEAAALDAGPAPEPGTAVAVAQQGQAEPPKLTNEQIIAGALSAGREIFCVVTKTKSPKATLTDEVTKQLGDVWGPVATKYGLDLSETMGQYALEFAAVTSTLAVIMHVRAAYQDELKDRTVDVEGAQVGNPQPIAE